MCKGLAAKYIVWSYLIPLLLVPLLGAQASKTKHGQSVYVVAIKTPWDASLFNITYVPGSPPGSRAPIPKPAPFRAPELFLSGGETIPGGVPDSDGKATIEKEFRKEKKYQIAGSAADADLIFLAETRTRSFVTVLTKGTAGPQPPELTWDGSSHPTWSDPDILSPPAGPSGVSFSGVHDEEPNLSSLAMAIAVPVEAYRRTPDNGAALYAARVWEGVVSNSNHKSVSLEDLVKKFHEGGALPAVSAIFTNPQPSRALAGSVINTVSTIPSGGLPAAGGKPNVSSANTAVKADGAPVTVPFIATDANGRYVSDLKQSELHIFEDNVEQKIDRFISEDAPLNVALLIDTSLSMSFKEPEIQQAAAGLAPALRADDSILVISFNSRVYLDSEFTSSREQILNAISQVRMGDNTRLYDALKLAVEERLRYVSGRKAIVLFTDGLDTSSGLTDEPGTFVEIEQSDAPVYVIQYDTRNRAKLPSSYAVDKAPKGYLDRDKVYAHATQYLQNLSTGSGGHFDQTANSTGAKSAFPRISDDLNHQYTIYYYPGTRSRAASLRHIRVTVDRPGVTIRSRTEYRPASNGD
jgi:VWFA-related protein